MQHVETERTVKVQAVVRRITFCINSNFTIRAGFTVKQGGNAEHTSSLI